MNQLCVDTLQRFAREGRLGAHVRLETAGVACRYRTDDNRRCAIGALLEDIPLTEEENRRCLTRLCMARPDITDRLLYMYNLTINEAEELQAQHDGTVFAMAAQPHGLNAALRDWAEGLRLAGLSLKVTPCP